MCSRPERTFRNDYLKPATMSRFTGLTDGDPCYGKDLPDQKEAETGVLPVAEHPDPGGTGTVLPETVRHTAVHCPVSCRRLSPAGDRHRFPDYDTLHPRLIAGSSVTDGHAGWLYECSATGGIRSRYPGNPG